MAWQEVTASVRGPSNFPADRVVLRVSGARNESGAQKRSTIFQLQIGAGILEMTKLNGNPPQYVRLEKGTDKDQGKIRLTKATAGRTVRRGKNESTPANIMLPKSLYPNFENLSWGIKECSARVLPDGALEVLLPRN